ncbi:MAG: hypothetical protein ACKV2V_24315 [Blastocatellia bacterium]
MNYLSVIASAPRVSRAFLVLSFCLFSGLSMVMAQPAKPADKAKKEDGKKEPAPAAQTEPQVKIPSKTPLYQKERVTLDDINTSVVTDKRVIVMMAALNMAGYDYETGDRPLSALRQQIREDLKNMRPELIRRLRDYFLSHRRGRADAASVAPYLSLALSLTEPPAFSLEIAADRLPEDVREILDFTLILEDFYRETNFGRLMPRYVAASEKVAQAYLPVTAQTAAMVLSYLHTEPILELPPTFVLRTEPQPEEKKPEAKKDKGGKKDKDKKDDKAAAAPVARPGGDLPMRQRRFVVIPDLLNATGAANLRVIRDSYYLLPGPSTAPADDTVRRGFLRFVLDPMTDRLLREVRAINEDLKTLRDTRGTQLDGEYLSNNAYYLVSDSLARAANERIALLVKIYSGAYADERALRRAVALAEEEATYRLSLPYERGAVLVYHFYDQMKAYEEVGINLRDYYGAMLEPAAIDFTRETRRLEDYKTRIANYKKALAEAAARPVVPETISNADAGIVARLNEADDLMKARKYADARAILESVRRERPNNARALFGLAEVISKQAQSVTDSSRLAEELYAAVQMYKESAQNASPETEKWLAQRGYVAAGKALEFLGSANASDLNDAAGAYELAVRLGDVSGGAYKEAVEGRDRVQQKLKQ